ncbi:hypothetical protein [Prosthecobacter vanneervenii]|uniref:Uncharacterized protein n=1 Tax=Prosthecobacter vanneervenii TaxID=48466 RepID=A0A7W7YBL1_9BACT|nr:hypothetical protein [Prosthecobacter vanneervenii]MBB5033179.1 hypothetical protein [Prosthecobacter vanneervenii]
MADVFGDCLKVSNFVSNITGAGTWNGSTGIFTVTLVGKGACGGSGTQDQGVCRLTVKACGKVKVTVSGTGYKYNVLATTCTAAVVSGPTIVSRASPGGGSSTDYCSTGPLTGATNGTADVHCGTQLLLTFGRLPHPGSDYGQITATFTVEAVAW